MTLIFSDCASVVSSRAPSDRVSGHRAYAGSIVEGFAGAVGSILGVTKVAAHKQPDDDGISASESHRRWGKHFADEAAKLGASKHPELDQETRDRANRYVLVSQA